MRIPASITVIENNAFQSCEDLREVIFAQNSSLKKISRHAFNECKSLKSIVFPEGLEEIENAVFFDSGLSEVVLPGSV